MDKETSVKEWGAAGMNSAMESEAMEECRACLQTIKKHTGYNLFEAWFTPWAVSGAIIADDLSKFADVEISEVDQFSKVICEKCYHRLSDACTFMITVQMSDTTLRERVDNNLKSTKSEVGILWPQPILVNKSGNGDVDNMEVEVKQEVLSEDENASNVDQDWEPTMDIKIEPEEISAPVQSSTQVNDERVGNLALVMNNPALVAPSRSQLTWIVRGMYSNPPAHGARVVAAVLANKQLYQEWKDHIKEMSTRVFQMREALRAELIRLKTPGSWEHIVKQIGLFSYTGLTQRQSEYLVQEFHIYLLKSGRINICGLNPSNVNYVAKAINDAVVKFPAEE